MRFNYQNFSVSGENRSVEQACRFLLQSGSVFTVHAGEEGSVITINSGP